MTIGDHLFGLPIFRVQDVFVPDRLTRVPLAPPEVAGILNLRGRVVTAIDMRSRLDLGARAKDAPVMAIGIELKGESYGLLVDSVGEVMPLAQQRLRGEARQSRSAACRGSPRESIGSRASSWSCSTSTACWTSRTVPLPRDGSGWGKQGLEGVERDEKLFGGG